MIIVEHQRTEIIWQGKLFAVARQALDDRRIKGVDIELVGLDAIVQRDHKLRETRGPQTLQADDVRQLAAGCKGWELGPVIRK